MSTDLQVERLVTRTFSALADEVPSLPPLTWSATKHTRQTGPEMSGTVTPITAKTRRGATPWLLSLGLVLGATGAGAAAAAGVFSSQADHQFRQAYSIPLPPAFGRIPAFNPHKEALEVTDPGPNGTTISVWTYPESPTIQCVAIVESERGEDTFPGKGPGNAGGCSGGLPSPGGAATTPPPSTVPPQDRTYGGDGGIWRSNTGVLYWLVGSTAPSGATRVVLSFSNGSTQSVAIRHGWFAVGYPDSGIPASYTGVFYGSSGQVIPGKAMGS